jgi:Cu/Ag efflux protein CusF
MKFKTTVVALAALCAIPVLAQGQKPVVVTESVERTATIEAIDHTSRAITLKNKDGRTETMVAGPEVKRFNELKVGDTLTFRYTESTAFSIRKAGEKAPAAQGPDAALTRGAGSRPSATMATQANATVVVKAIDPKVPSVTVLTDENKLVTLKVADKKNIEGLKVGDKVDITYTEALMISVK